MLSDSPAEIMWQLMVNLGLGTDQSLGLDWPIGVAVEPDLPDNCITVYDTSWKQDGRSMSPGDAYYHYGVQVRVRSTDHPTGFKKAMAIKTAFDENVNMASVTVNENTYTVAAVGQSAVLSIGQDTPKTKRQVFTLNPLVAIADV